MTKCETLTSDIKWVEANQDQCIVIRVDAVTNPYLSQARKQPHRHSHHEIIWVTSGCVEHLLDDKVEILTPGMVVVVPMGRMHRYIVPDGVSGCGISDVSGYGIRFREEFLTNTSNLLFSRLVGHSALQLTPEQSVDMEGYFSLIYREYHQADPYHLEPLRHLLSALIAKLEELRLLHFQMQPHDYAHTVSIWNRFSALIEKKFKVEHNVGYYASELGVSSRKLREVVKLYTGKNVAEVIDECLTMEARRLLLFSDLSIKDIAFDLGFEEHSYFSKVFKRLTGMTPSDFKANAVTAWESSNFSSNSDSKKEHQ